MKQFLYIKIIRIPKFYFIIAQDRGVMLEIVKSIN